MSHYTENGMLYTNFFRIFARLEFALKRAGFLKNYDRVEVDWNSFAESINAQFQAAFDESQDFKLAVDFIEEDPPRKLVKALDTTLSPICWRIVPPNQGDRLKDLLVYIRRIRNNLFHGEKQSALLGGNSTTVRDDELLRKSITILDELVSFNPQVQSFMEKLHPTPRC